MSLLQLTPFAVSAAIGGGVLNLAITPTTLNSCGIFCVMWKNPTAGFTGCTDNKAGGSQTYTTERTQISGNQTGAIGICPGNAAGVSQVSYNFTGTGELVGCYAEESNIALSAPIDTGAAPTSAAFTSTPWSSGAMAASANPNLTLFGFSFSGNSANVGFASTGLNWAAAGAHFPNTTDGDDGYLQRATVTATGAYASTGTMSGNNNGGALVIALIQAITAAQTPFSQTQFFVNDTVFQQ